MELKPRNERRSLSRPREFRHFLQDELTRRCARNPKYSLRSFAQALGISASALSAILNGKRPVTHKMKERLGLQLGLEMGELRNFASRSHGNRKSPADGLATDAGSFHQVTIDTFAIISEPYHYALLELIKTKGFSWDAKWIARRLAITPSEVNIAIERLERIGLLARDAAGELQDATGGFSTDLREGLTSQAQRRFQQRSLEQAAAAIPIVPPELRDNTSMTMAIHTGDLPLAKKFIKEFRRRFCRELESRPGLDEVYQLTVAFVPVTTLPGDKK